MARRSPVVYLLHFAQPYKHARHYIGYSEQLAERLAHHQKGTGARLMAAVSAAGIEVTVARVWKGADRTFERRIHGRKHSAQLCPLCSGDSALGRAKVRGTTPAGAR
jgi:predicted GIY-YIG superfamily endonuclease